MPNGCSALISAQQQTPPARAGPANQQVRPSPARRPGIRRFSPPVTTQPQLCCQARPLPRCPRLPAPSRRSGPPPPPTRPRVRPPPPSDGSVPAAITALVGRRDELSLIAEQLTTSRLVTLIGPGGAGKTTLALETARGRRGAIIVELAPTAPDEVWPAVAAAVGRTFRLNEASAQPVGSRDRAIETLAGRSLLLVLDNCEHVSAEAAHVARDLLQGVPGASLLATSREPLGLPGEAFVTLGPLPEADGVELFTRRVRAARGRPPEPGDAEAVARIVRRLDGLPLALELAAAKSRTLSIAEIDTGLDDRFALLARGPRAADPRHQTLRALIDWSWETLTEPERAALVAAAVFPDGIGTLDAGVVARRTGTDAQAFDQLVDRSLLHRADGRFRMLETVREYGLDRLRSEGRLAELRSRQARAMVELATPKDALLRGPQVREGLAWFDLNEENLSSALRAAQALPRARRGWRAARSRRPLGMDHARAFRGPAARHVRVLLDDRPAGQRSRDGGPRCGSARGRVRGHPPRRSRSA